MREKRLKGIDGELEVDIKYFFLDDNRNRFPSIISFSFYSNS